MSNLSTSQFDSSTQTDTTLAFNTQFDPHTAMEI